MAHLGNLALYRHQCLPVLKFKWTSGTAESTWGFFTALWYTQNVIIHHHTTSCDHLSSDTTSSVNIQGCAKNCFCLGSEVSNHTGNIGYANYKMLVTNDWCNNKVHFSMYMLKHCYEWCTENTVGGVELSGKYSTRWTRDPTLSTIFFCTSRVNSVLTGILFCIGRISSCSSNGPGT